MNWVRFGDDNNAFFYQSIKHLIRHNKIMFIRFKRRDITNPSQIHQAFFDFYSELFYFEGKDRVSFNVDTYQGLIISSHHHTLLNLKFSPIEIKHALLSILDDKAPRLDGYNSGFYKASREVLGDDIIF